MTRRMRRGFTVVELLVATTISATALLGVYALLSQAGRAERTMGAQWHDRAAAQAVVDEIAQTLEQAMNVLKDIPAIAGGKANDGTCWVECVTGRAWAEGSPGGYPCRVRYSYDPPGQVDQGVVVRKQTIRYSGGTCIDPGDLAEMPPADAWGLAPSQVVANRVSEVSVEFMPLEEPGLWRDKFAGPSGKVAIRIVAAVGDRRAERVVVPAVNVPGEQEQP